MSYDFNVIVNAEMPSLSADGFGTILAVSTELDVDYQIVRELKDVEVMGEYEGSDYETLLTAIFSQKPAPSKVILVGEEGGSVSDIVEEQLEVDDDFFFIVADSELDLIDMEYIETLEKVAFTRVSEAEDFELFAESEFENSVGIYAPEENGVTGALAVVMGYNVGGRTAHAKVLKGVKPVTVSPEDKEVILSNSGNLFIRANNRNRLVGGTALNGQWLDIVLGKYWIKFTLEQRLDDLITSVDKIPYNNEGVGMIAGTVSTVLSEAKERGILESFEIDTKDVNEISAEEKSTRQYDYLTATGYLVGAIHGGEVNINLVYKEAEIDG